MDQQIGSDQKMPPDQQAAPYEQPDDQRTAPNEQQAARNEQAAAYGQEPMSVQFVPIPPEQITQEGNEAYLLQHQRQLRSAYPSCDLSEVSYHTEHADFPGSRHSSLNTEPLTLDADQIHDAKDQACDALQMLDKDTGFNIFTKDTLKTIFGRVSMMEYYWRQGQEPPFKVEEVPIRSEESPSKSEETLPYREEALPTSEEYLPKREETTPQDMEKQIVDNQLDALLEKARSSWLDHPASEEDDGPLSGPMTAMSVDSAPSVEDEVKLKAD